MLFYSLFSDEKKEKALRLLPWRREKSWKKIFFFAAFHRENFAFIIYFFFFEALNFNNAVCKFDIYATKKAKYHKNWNL